MINYQSRSESEYLYAAGAQLRGAKGGYDGIWQIAPFSASIPYSASELERLKVLEHLLTDEFPSLSEFGRARARKAYGSHADTITKPNYTRRIRDYLGSGVDQISSIINVAAKEPASGGLCFSVFAPEDMINRQRPGYVPCLMSGTFLLHNGELHLNAFFRSQSLIEFGIYDLLHLRALQQEMLRMLHDKDIVPDAKCGPLNLFLARVFVHRRILKRKDGSFTRRDAVFDRWMSLIYERGVLGL